MRAGGGCTFQQALTGDAASIIKQSAALAQRRGHAQVTPLHVASTMLAASSGLFRTACRRSRSDSHPLLYRALELCFNVALNRLPAAAAAASGGSILGHHHHCPSMSNALLAAFKRAQAHQRRGSVETQQQQPAVLAVKIELEQLIISILDDPSVSRVMREAGFSSAQVKSNVEQAISAEQQNQPLDRVANNSPIAVESSSNGLIIPAGSLGLSLNPVDSVSQSHINRSPKGGEEGSGSLLFLEGDRQRNRQRTTCYPSANCLHDSENEEAGQSLHSCSTSKSDSTTSSTLPAWLQKYKDETNAPGNSDQSCVPVGDLCRRWNSNCSTSGQPNNINSNSSERTLTFSSCVSPSSSISGFSYEHHNFWNLPDTVNNTTMLHESTFKRFIPEKNYGPDQPSSSSPCPNSTPASSSGAAIETDYDQHFLHGFKELNPEYLEILITALQKKVPQQRDAIPEIAAAVLQCRSGMLPRKIMQRDHTERWVPKEDAWLFFQGADTEAKEKVALELARLVFGSKNNCFSIALSSFSSTRADSTEDCLMLSNKRLRDEQSRSYLERFAEAVLENPHRVFFVEDVEQADYCSQKGIKRAAERGRIVTADGEEVCLSDAIIILSCESLSSRSRACSPRINRKLDHDGLSKVEDMNETSSSNGVTLDLNISICDDDDGIDEDDTMDGIGLVQSMDKRIVFNVQDL